MRRGSVALLAAAMLFLPAAQESIESCFTSHVNSQRSSELTTRADLVALARRHSQRMASSGRIFHNSNLASEAPEDWLTVGENVGVGPTCDQIHRAFMNSAAHRKNIVDTDFNLIGVGVVTTANGAIYVTQVFMEAPGGARPGPAPAGTDSAPVPEVAVPGSGATERTVAYLDLLEDDRVSEEPIVPTNRPPPKRGGLRANWSLATFIAASISAGL